MKYQNKRVSGIWIDHQEAYIISTPDRNHTSEFQVIKKLTSRHHSNHSSNENAHHHKLAQEIHHMYQEVAAEIIADDAIFITGPGNAQEEFKNFLMQDKKNHNKEIVIGTSDHPTANQRIAQIREHFQAS